MPIEKNWTSRAISGAMTAADGTSIIVPIGSLRLNGMPSSSRSSLTSARISLHWRNSSSVLTIGNMIRTLPCQLALRIARICVLNKAKLRKQRRTLRKPIDGLCSLLT